MQPQTAIVTGAAGFLGRYIVRQFAAEGWRVVGVDNIPQEQVPVRSGTTYLQTKLPDPLFRDLLRAERPQVCIHCAGRASVPDSLRQPAEDFRDNTGLTFELLDTLRQNASSCRFILLSSAAVYGNPAALPVRETDTIAPLSPYGFHKRQCELLCEEFARVYGMDTASVRIFSAYGPGLRRQVVWDICKRVITARAVSLQGTGKESRDFIHAADVARALALISKKERCEADIYNLATGREVSIEELAIMIVSALDTDIRPAFDGTERAGDPKNWRADVSRVEALGFRPLIALEQGIRTVATWASAELAMNA